MDFLNLVRDVGFPLALLTVAVITLWKVWRLDSKTFQAKLDEKDNRIIKLYELLARPVLEKLGDTALAELEALNKSLEKADPGCKK